MAQVQARKVSGQYPHIGHASYKYMWDCTLPDHHLPLNHFFINMVIGDKLVTALKDENTANSSIT